MKAKEQDRSRYFLQAQTKKGDDKEFAYKKYKLSDHKTFDTLYFPEKDPLLQIVDDFELKYVLGRGVSCAVDVPSRAAPTETESETACRNSF